MMGIESIRNPWLRDELAAYLALRSAWYLDPVRYAWDRFGLRPTSHQRQMLEAIAPDGAKVSCRSGHGTGKSTGMAVVGWWFLETREFCRIPCTAPTAHQLRDVLWAELAKLLRSANDRSRRRGDHPALWLSSLFRVTSERIHDPSSPGEWFLVGRTSRPENPDALQGFHASDVQVSEDGTSLVETGDLSGKLLFLVDEAAGVVDEVFHVAEGALSSHGSRLLMAANPTRSVGYFARSQREDRGDFTALHFRSSDSPLVSPDYRAKLVRKWGEGSNIVRVRADGEFPKQDDDALIAIEHAEAAIKRPLYQDERADIRIGVDPARFGSDRAVIAARQGRNLLHMEIHARSSETYLAGAAINLARIMQARGRVAGIWVEVNGFGGVADIIRERGWHVVEVDAAAAAPPLIGADKTDMTPRRMRDYLWLMGRNWLRDEAPSFGGLDKDMAEDLSGELATPRYSFDSSGAMVVESKDELRKPNRIGRSPDLADAVNVTHAPDTGARTIATGVARIF